LVVSRFLMRIAIGILYLFNERGIKSIVIFSTT
jgi:hypothetical protein